MSNKVGGPNSEGLSVTARAPKATTANLLKGQAVSYTGNNEVEHTADGGIVHGQVMGVIVKADGDLVGVMRGGVQRFEYTGTAPVVGNSVVGSATAGKVKAAAASANALVVAVDTAAATVDVML